MKKTITREWIIDRRNIREREKKRGILEVKVQ
jgi:hypothetical protein